MSCDKFFPDALLICAKPVFNTFVKTFKINPALQDLLSAARRRHANRIHKRLSRKRRAATHTAATSDKADDCPRTSSTVIFSAVAVYQELQDKLRLMSTGSYDSPDL